MKRSLYQLLQQSDAGNSRETSTMTTASSTLVIQSTASNKRRCISPSSSAEQQKQHQVDKNGHPTETLKQLYFKDDSNSTTVDATPNAGNDHSLDDEDAREEARASLLANYTLPVVNAIRSENLSQLQDMLAKGQSFEACNNQGESLLHMACRRTGLPIIRFLVQEAKVNVAVRDDVGRSILHDLCWRPTVELPILEFLLPHLLKAQAAALLVAPDARGHTPFDYSRNHDWSQWNAFFLKGGKGAELLQEHQQGAGEDEISKE